MKLYFARHGESETNVQRIHWDKQHGYGLTEKEREQAEALAADLADIQFAGSEFTTLYCSRILRAAQTAQIVDQRFGARSPGRGWIARVAYPDCLWV